MYAIDVIPLYLYDVYIYTLYLHILYITHAYIHSPIYTGFSTVTALPHTGILYQSELVQSQPHSLRRKILSTIANKVVLLARIDSYSSHTADSQFTTGTGIDNSQGIHI